MECRDVKKLLSEYIDGVLAEGQVPVIKQHLVTCRDCKETYASMSRLIDAMSEMETVEEPADFAAAVRNRLERRPSFFERFRVLWSPPLIKVPMGVAAALVVAFAITQLPGPDRQPTRDLVVTDEMKLSEETRAPAEGRREKKGDLEKETPAKPEPPPPDEKLESVVAGDAADRPPVSDYSEKQPDKTEPPVVAVGETDTDGTAVDSSTRGGRGSEVQIEIPPDTAAKIQPPDSSALLRQPEPTPAAPAAATEPVEVDDLLRITRALDRAGGTIVITEENPGGEPGYLIARLAADSIYTLVHLLGEETELIMAHDLGAFGLAAESPAEEKTMVQSNRARTTTAAEGSRTGTNAVERSRAATDSIFVRIRVK
jgi:hypothetical protein